MQEVREEYPKLLALITKNSIPEFVDIDTHVLRQMFKDRHQMASLLCEFTARHPEDADLARRAKRFV